MKFVGVREAQARLSGLVDESQGQRIVLTRRGQPIAVLIGVEGKDLEEFILAQDPEFRSLIAERRSDQGPLVSHEELRAQAGRELAQEEAGTAPVPSRPRRRSSGK